MSRCRQVIARWTFDQFDQNGDGVLDRSEIAKVLAWTKSTYKLLNFVPEDVQQFLDRVDEDKSGDVSYEEFLKAFASIA